VAGESGAEALVGEPRWHMATAVVAAIVLTILMPDEVRLGPNWLLPLIEGALLIALIVGDPGKLTAARPRSGRSASGWSRCWSSARRGRPSCSRRI
jgi:hypothetical protein